MIVAGHRGEPRRSRRGSIGPRPPGALAALARARALLAVVFLAVARSRHSQCDQGQQAGSNNPEHRRLSLSVVRQINENESVAAVRAP